jgi:hypothetical protein
MKEQDWSKAYALSALLPARVAWVFNTTNIEGDAVLNMWVDRGLWELYATLLHLDTPDETNSDSVTWYDEGGFALSLIQPEEHSGRDNESV